MSSLLLPILARAAQRLMLPSAVLSTAGLYRFPTNQATSLVEALKAQIDDLALRSPELANLIHRAARQQEFLSAPDALRLGVIDKIQTVRPRLPMRKEAHRVRNR